MIFASQLMILAAEPESPLNARSAALGVRPLARVICMPQRCARFGSVQAASSNKGFWKRIVDIQSDQFREMRIDNFLIEDYPISAKVQERCLLWGARVIATSVYLLSSKISAS